MSKIEFGEKSKVCIKWKVNPIDYTDLAEKNIIEKFAAKYKINKDNIKVEPDFIRYSIIDDDEGYSDNISVNIQDKEFQRKLFKKFFEERGVSDYDFESITAIDDTINSMIDVELFSSNNKYQIKWIKWSNFMSYGKDNYFDFTNLDGLVLLTSEPSNQGGKTTFCIDLLRFLLFGKVTSREDDWVLAESFNRFLPEETEVSVEGCITINGSDYVIKRTVTRPALKKRTEKSKATHKVSYYKLVNNDTMVELEDVEVLDGQTNRETSKTIKEYIGNESDFDLMICVNADNLKRLISLKDTERGRLISRWIGLLPLEQKDKLARDYFNKNVIPSLLSNRYDKDGLTKLLNDLSVNKESLEKELNNAKAIHAKTKAELERLNNEYTALLQSKTKIDESLLKVDVTTVENKLKMIKTEGSRFRALKEQQEKELEEITCTEFNEENYKVMVESQTKLSNDIAVLREKCNYIKKEIEALTKSEYCPTCGAKIQGVDNKQAISLKKIELDHRVKEGVLLSNQFKVVTEEIKKLEAMRDEYNKRTKLLLSIEVNDAQIKKALAEYKENEMLLKSIEANRASIESNNKIETSINVVKVSISEQDRFLKQVEDRQRSLEYDLKNNENETVQYTKILEKVSEEEKLVKSWKQYLELVGKNGICKLVLRSALPVINGELKRLLNGVCDFEVSISIDDRNDVAFSLIHDGVTSKLASGSGFEQTVASIALRSVLSKISTFNKPSFVVFDEVLGGVSDENYDQVKLLYDKIVSDYGFIFQITHLKQIADWHNKTIVVKKVNNVSKIISV